jgi:hypothetical protein
MSRDHLQNNLLPVVGKVVRAPEFVTVAAAYDEAIESPAFTAAPADPQILQGFDPGESF